MNYKQILIAFLLVFTCFNSLWATPKRGLAVVVDTLSYQKTEGAIEAYRLAVEKEGLQTYLLLDRWGSPDSIKKELMVLHQQKEAPIEGAVFIGDIPIPMIRDAQHLTSAFKMNQTLFPFEVSSVPSDRFYDDFDLKFNFIRRDEKEPLYFYYSLAADSKQYLSPTIYSGRIKMSGSKEERYDRLSAYLERVVEQKEQNRSLNQLLYFSGHGYVSESLMARIDEKNAYYENFPWLKQQQNGIEYIDHQRDVSVKERLINEMGRKDLDLAVLHHHGDAEIEYLNNYPNSSSIRERVEALKFYLREVMREAQQKGKPIEEVKGRLEAQYGSFPSAWYAKSFDVEQQKEDSLFLRSLDLFVEDFNSYTPNVLFVVLDACFNGSFHKENYIAGEYISGKGRTQAVLANSVNVLQEKWTDRYLGMLGLGMRVGYLVQYNPFLESHIIGDPTFHFTSKESRLPVNILLQQPEKKWEKLRKSEYPGLQAMALRKLFDAKRMNSEELLRLFKNSPAHVVRMESLMLLAQCNDSNFIEALNLAVTDSYEMVQRFAMNFIAKSGDGRLIPALVRTASANNTARRMEFNIKQALSLFPEQEILQELERGFKSELYHNPAVVKEAIRYSFSVNTKKWVKEIQSIYADSSMSQKKRIGLIRYLRNYPLHHEVPALLNYLQQIQEEEVQLALLEALGWFTLSYQNEEIAKVAYALSKDKRKTKAVQLEALKTYYRLVNQQ